MMVVDRAPKTLLENCRTNQRYSTLVKGTSAVACVQGTIIETAVTQQFDDI